MFLATLSTIVKLWTESKCPSNNRYIRKLCIYTYDGILPTKIMKSCQMIWMELQCITLSENKSIRERQIPYDVTCVWNLINETDEHRGKNRGKP